MRSTESSVAVVFCLFLAMVLTVVPMPDSVMMWRPAWVPLVLIYWVVAAPHKVGVVAGFCCGLLLDNLEGGVLGQNALALTCVAYTAYALHNRLRVYALWQQSLSVMVMVGIYQLINLMVARTVSLAPWGMSYWWPSLTSGIVWPWVMLALGGVRSRGRMV